MARCAWLGVRGSVCVARCAWLGVRWRGGGGAPPPPPPALRDQALAWCGVALATPRDQVLARPGQETSCTFRAGGVELVTKS
jgi:hypothetical protein